MPQSSCEVLLPFLLLVLPSTFSASFSSLNYITMNNRKSISLVRHFLKSSPHSQLALYQQMFKLSPYKAVMAVPDKTYLNNFLKSVEVFGTPGCQLGKYRSPSMPNLLKNKHEGIPRFRLEGKKDSQVDQLKQCIKELSAPTSPSITSYQELEQRITLAEPASITAVRTKLTYLFKILLNRRDKMAPQSFELEANILLSQAIIQKFGQNSEFGQNIKQWNKLQAMEKLFRAREYKKKGLGKIAFNACQQIFKNEDAAYQTRLQALRFLCSEGQEEGNASQLESLVSVASQKGEKEYEQYLKIVITRIKNGVENKAPEE